MKSLLKCLSLSAGLAGLLIVSNPALATIQDAKQSVNDDSEILVIGQKQRKNRVNSFIKTIIKPTQGDQYASFQGRVCPVAMGLPEEHGQVVEQRMFAVAKAADLKTGKADCQPNMAVVVVNDPSDFFAELRREYPQILAGISIPERNRLINGPGPAYAWQAIAARGPDGFKGSITPASMGMIGGSERVPGLHAANLGNRGARSGATRAANSRINRSTRLDINLAVMLVDKKALEGVTLRQLGDYGLMRLLGHTRDVKFEDINERSILSLFTDRAEDFDPPETVTAWDMAFMKSLYKAKGTKSAARQRSAMARTFDRELVKWAEQTREE